MGVVKYIGHYDGGKEEYQSHRMTLISDYDDISLSSCTGYGDTPDEAYDNMVANLDNMIKNLTALYEMITGTDTIPTVKVDCFDNVIKDKGV